MELHRAKEENMLAVFLFLLPSRAVGDFRWTAANVALPYCAARDGLALFGHVDGRESRADKDRRHCTAAVFVLVHAQPHGCPWNGILHPDIRNLFIETLGPLSVGAMLHPRRGRFLQCDSVTVPDRGTPVAVRHF